MEDNSYFEDPNIEDEEFAYQDGSDYVKNPPTGITIGGVKYDLPNIPCCLIRREKDKDGESIYLVSEAGKEDRFWISSTSRRRWKVINTVSANYSGPDMGDEIT